MNVIQEINNVNDKFATQGSKLKIENRGEKLNIRGSLPSKENNNNFKIQRISLGLKADISGLEEAKKKLQLINLQLELNQFDWINCCLLYTSPSPRDTPISRMPSSA